MYEQPRSDAGFEAFRKKMNLGCARQRERANWPLRERR